MEMSKGRIRFIVFEALLLVAYVGFLSYTKMLVEEGSMSVYPDCVQVQGIATFLWALPALALAAFEGRRQNREEPQPVYTPEEKRKRLAQLAALIVVSLAVVYGIGFLLHHLGVFFASIEDLNEFVMRTAFGLVVLFVLNAYWLYKRR